MSKIKMIEDPIDRSGENAQIFNKRDLKTKKKGDHREDDNR